jgi:chemotaxis protein methyltransferase CheR
MLQARLQRRLRTLDMTSYGQYLEYLRSLKGWRWNCRRWSMP